MPLPGFEAGIPCLQDRRYNHNATKPRKMEHNGKKIIYTNKPGKQNYKTNFHHFNISCCPDLNQGSPANNTAALTTTLQRHVQTVTMDKNHLEK